MLAVNTASDFAKGNTMDMNAVQTYASVYPPNTPVATRDVTEIQVVVDDLDRRALEIKGLTFWASDLEANRRNTYT